MLCLLDTKRTESFCTKSIAFVYSNCQLCLNINVSCYSLLECE